MENKKSGGTLLMGKEMCCIQKTIFTCDYFKRNFDPEPMDFKNYFRMSRLWLECSDYEHRHKKQEANGLRHRLPLENNIEMWIFEDKFVTLSPWTTNTILENYLVFFHNAQQFFKRFVFYFLLLPLPLKSFPLCF